LKVEPGVRQDDGALRARFGVIGYGAITEEMICALEALDELDRLTAVLVRSDRVLQAREKAAGRFKVVSSIEALLDTAPEVVCECAGQDALREFGEAALASGRDLVCASVGALAQRELAGRLERASRDGSRILIPSGAVAGIDGLLAARTAGLRQVTYTSVKPPLSWTGTPGEGKLAGAAREQRTTLFEATAREAALLYPKNANVGATVAFAGLGLDRTTVRLVSDPAVSGPLGIIEAEGDFGTFRFEILAYASRTNPKTSALTAHSMLAAVRDGVAFALAPQ
jgi:aspartate dehydrogenase